MRQAWATISLVVLSLLLAQAITAPSPTASTGEEERPFRFHLAILEVDGRSLSVSMYVRVSILSTIPPSEREPPCELTNSYGRAEEGFDLPFSFVGNETMEYFWGEVLVFRYEVEARLKLRPYGPGELYPHDSYLFNLSFTFEDGGLAEEGLISVVVECAEDLWRIQASARLVRHSPEASLVVEVVLSRMSWLFSPYYLTLLVSSVLLGASLLIGPENLASRLGLYLSLLFSLISMLGFMGGRAPEARATSVAECLLLDLCVSTCLLCVESVLEHVSYGRMGHKPYALAQTVLKLLFAAASAAIFLLHLSFFTAISGSYPWAEIPLLDFLIPITSLGTLSLLAAANEATRPAASTTPRPESE